MSTSTPSESSRGPLNDASTTYVAPCRRWAGPKASPRKLWAIIMWSRTVTVNTSRLPRSTVGIDDAPAERRQRRPRRAPPSPSGSSSNARLPRQQHVERRVAQQVERQGEPLGVRTPAAPRRRDLADLAGPDRQPARVEGAAERDGDRRVAVPAELDAPRRPAPAGRARSAGPRTCPEVCTHEVQTRRAPRRAAANVAPSAPATDDRDASTSTSVTLDPRERRRAAARRSSRPCPRRRPRPGRRSAAGRPTAR